MRRVNVERVNPYDNDREKGKQVEEMFDSIAPAYDFMNTAMTFGLHRYWRNTAIKKALASIGNGDLGDILDVATGTGDLVFYLHSKLPDAVITGIDLSSGMLEIARKKLDKLSDYEKGLISFNKGDCLSLPYPDSKFDLVTVAYGVRNFSQLSQGLKEMGRVLKKNGVLCIIELSCPDGMITAPCYKFYSGKLIPSIGKLVSGDSRAYSYLPESISACPQRDDMASLMKGAGFSDIKWKSLTFGAVTYYLGRK